MYSPEKNFRLKWDFVNVEDVLLRNSEYSVRVMGLLNFLLHCCIVVHAICYLKCWNITKSGGQFALQSNSKLWETRPHAVPCDWRFWWSLPPRGSGFSGIAPPYFCQNLHSGSFKPLGKKLCFSPLQQDQCHELLGFRPPPLILVTRVPSHPEAPLPLVPGTKIAGKTYTHWLRRRMGREFGERSWNIIVEWTFYFQCSVNESCDFCIW